MKRNYLLLYRWIKTVSQFKNKTALIINQCEISYQTLYEDCLRFIKYINITPLSRGARIIIQAGNSYLGVVAFWSSVMCDCVPCVIDHECAGDILRHLIEKIEPEIIVFDELRNDQFDIICSFKIDYVSHLPERVEIQYSFDDFQSINTESDLLMIMHTSGSTGNPKGVMLSNRNVLAAIDSISSYLHLNSSDIILSVLPMHFDYGLYQMLLAFNLGATLALEKNLLFPNVVAHHISKYKATVLPCVPLMAQLFHLSAQRYQFDFSSLRMVTNTGEHLSLSHIQKIKNLFPSADIFSMYGLTECKRCSYVPPYMLDKKYESIGIPMPNLEMWIQDANGNRLPPNQEGDLVIAGPTLMMGYWKNPAESEKKIQTDVFGKRILISGDRAVMDEDGYFYFKGRNDFLVKYKGIKLNCFEYVKKLSAISDIDRSYLFLNQSNDEQELIVCIEMNLNNKNMNELKTHIFSHFLSTQKPSHIYFTQQFPSLSNGKLDKHQLEKRAVAVCI